MHGSITWIQATVQTHVNTSRSDGQDRQNTDCLPHESRFMTHALMYARSMSRGPRRSSSTAEWRAGGPCDALSATLTTCRDSFDLTRITSPGTHADNNIRRSNSVAALGSYVKLSEGLTALVNAVYSFTSNSRTHALLFKQ